MDRRTEAITISPSLFLKKRGDKNVKMPTIIVPGHVAQTVTCLATDAKLTAHSMVNSSNIRPNDNVIRSNRSIADPILL